MKAEKKIIIEILSVIKVINVRENYVANRKLSNLKRLLGFKKEKLTGRKCPGFF